MLCNIVMTCFDWMACREIFQLEKRPSEVEPPRDPLTVEVRACKDDMHVLIGAYSQIAQRVLQGPFQERNGTEQI